MSKQSDTQDAAILLDEVTRLRARARRHAHAGVWFPVAALAALVLASITLYATPFAQAYWHATTAPYWAGLPDTQREPALSYLYWFLATPATFALIGAWYRRRAALHGVRVQWRWFAGIGLGALLALAVLAAVPAAQPSYAYEVVDGTATLTTESPLAGQTYLGGQVMFGFVTPLMPIVAALLALAWVERSRMLAAAGLWVGVITWWQCSQGMGSLPGWATWVLGGFQGPALGGELTLFGLNRPGPTLLLIALPLLVFATVRGLRDRGVRP